jgi:HAD superfamily hydrolase (TIGR01509 family)
MLSYFDAIIFDCDGVIVDSEIIHVSIERELLSEYGLFYSLEVYLSRFMGLAMPDYYAELERDYQAKFDKPFPTSFEPELTRRAWPRIEAELKAVPDLEDLVSSLTQPVAVASSSPIDRLTQKLEITGLSHLFKPHIYSAQRVENGKPAPDLFLFAAKQLNVSPLRCVVIEDSENGVRAGCAAGMSVIGFTGGQHADPGLAERLKAAGAHHIASGHAELFSR